MESVPAKSVRFLVTDLVHPHPARVLLELFQRLTIEGEVAAATTDGDTPYFVVRIAGVSEPVIVPQSKAEIAELADCAPSPQI